MYTYDICIPTLGHAGPDIWQTLAPVKQTTARDNLAGYQESKTAEVTANLGCHFKQDQDARLEMNTSSAHNHCMGIVQR